MCHLRASLFRYKTNPLPARKQHSQTFFLLMDLMQFFDLYHEGKMDDAFEVRRFYYLMIRYMFSCCCVNIFL